MKIMITGAAGFIGTALTRYCSEAGCGVLGFDVREAAPDWPGDTFELCDIRDEGRVTELVSQFRPDRVFHLAAQSYPTVSLVQPRETVDVNVGGTVNLYESMRVAGVSAVTVVACSSAEYGPVASADLPVRETHPLRPLHPYGVSKVGQDLLAAQYFSNYGIPSVRIRIFNTTGPGKIGDVCSDLTKRAVEIEVEGKDVPLAVGNLTTRRALIDVRDMVRALWLSSERCEPGEVYNVGGSDVYSVQDVIDMIRRSTKESFGIEQDLSLVRVCDEPVIAGDISKFRARTGWTATIGLNETLRDMLEWWRRKLAPPSVSRQPGVETLFV